MQNLAKLKIFKKIFLIKNCLDSPKKPGAKDG